MTTFFRLLQSDDKETALGNAVAAHNSGEPSAQVIQVDPASFEQVPGSPFAYWVSDRVRRLFSDFPMFDSEREGRATRCGLGTTDNFRFLRLQWEVVANQKNSDWIPYYDGGVYSPVYDLFPLVVWWKNAGREIKDFVAGKFGSASRKVQGEDYYKKPGFVFPRRTRGLCPKVLARGGIFSNAGQAGFVPEHDLLATIGFLSSRICSLLISLSQGRTGDAAQFEVGLIKRLPWVKLDHGELATRLRRRTQQICDSKRLAFQGDELSHVFVAPHLFLNSIGRLRDRLSEMSGRFDNWGETISEAIEDLNASALDAYQLSPDDTEAILTLSETEDAPTSADEEDTTAERDGDANTGSHKSFVADAISYAVGCVFGRWDVRYATGQKLPAELPAPFDPLPVCSPGMLQGDDGLPLLSTPDGYTLRIDSDGIIPDDEQNSDDIVHRVNEVLELIWKDGAAAVEEEMCEILNVKDLRNYFHKPSKGGFWDDHVSRYSKSRRKAPIYWLLQSSKKNYGLWLYYHRLDKDMLFKALQPRGPVQTKINLEQGKLDALRTQKKELGEGKGAKKLDKDIEKQDLLVAELEDFAKKLRRAANLDFGKDLDSSVVYEPDLNDGVVLNIAPLWELVPWKEAKSYWDELLAGEYGWSSMGKLLRKKGLVK